MAQPGMGGRVDEGDGLESCRLSSKDTIHAENSKAGYHGVNMDPDLAALIESWPELAEHIRTAIIALVQAGLSH